MKFMLEFSATRKMVALEGRVQLFESAKKATKMTRI